MSNLLENAIKFTEIGFVEFGYALDKTHDEPVLKLYVKDTGIGINRDRLEVIFERFSQGDKSIAPNYGGLGLGLAIAKENAMLIGGSLTVKPKGIMVQRLRFQSLIMQHPSSLN